MLDTTAYAVPALGVVALMLWKSCTKSLSLVQLVDVGHHRARVARAWRGGADDVEELHEDVVNGARIHALQITPELNSEHCAGV